MAGTARDSLERAISLIGAYNAQDAEVELKQEDTLDLYEDRLDTYLGDLSALALSQQDSRRGGKMQHAIGDFERLGDHAVNLAEWVEYAPTGARSKNGHRVSPEAQAAGWI